MPFLVMCAKSLENPGKHFYKYMMQGMAQKLFAERGGMIASKPQAWPLVAKAFSYVDYALAQHFLRGIANADESHAVLIAYLSLAVREGHLCIRIDEEGISPAPDQLCQGDDAESLCKLIVKGASSLSEELLTDVSNTPLSVCPVTPICKFHNLFYFQRYWRHESAIIDNYCAIAAAIPEIQLDRISIENSLEALLQKGKLLPEQADAIRLVCSGTVSFIVGGPGTGKTHTAGELIKIFWASLSEHQRKECSISLAAPTGKAAANLQKSLRRAIGEMEDFPILQATTLHTLLGIRSLKSKDEHMKLSADLILIDESSMIDVHLMERLLAMVKDGARLILFGDRHQLPPVAAGMVFSDLIAMDRSRSQELTVCLRAELKSIIDFASTINRGDIPSTLQMLASGINGVRRVPFISSSSKSMQQSIVEEALPFFLETIDKDPENLLESFSRYRILCPLRQGPLGVDALNAVFLKQMILHCQNKNGFAAPIMLITNDQRLELANGEVGVLIRKNPNAPHIEEGDYAIFSSRDETQGALRKLPALLLPKFEYAYCLSVHKSQGSEFDRILLLMPEGAERFGREVLYTAVTRSRRHLDIWGSDETLAAAIALKAQRLSGLSKRLASRH